MCVANFRGAVCSPPGVSNSGRPLNLILFRLSDQILNALNRSGTFQLAVINNGDVKTGRITNTANGGTGMNIGGICAFTLGAGTKLNYCTNNGEISAPTGRGGGLVGTLGGSTTEENGTVIANSTNNGTIQDDAIGQYGGSKDYYNYKRMGGLVGGTVTNNNLRIEYCTNNGNVFSQLGCRT